MPRLPVASPWYVAMTVTKAVDFGVYEIEHVPDAKTQPEGLKVLDSLLFQSTFPVGLPPGAVTAHVVAFHFESGFGLPEVDVLVGVVSGTAKSGEAMPLLVVGIGGRSAYTLLTDTIDNGNEARSRTTSANDATDQRVVVKPFQRLSQPI